MEFSISNICHLCKEAKDTTMHYLVNYKFVSLVWFVSPLCLRPFIGNTIVFFDWIKSSCDMNHLSKCDRENILKIIAIFAWSIWKSRNKPVFEKAHLNMLTQLLLLSGC